MDKLHENIVKVVKEVMGVDIGSMPRTAKFKDIPQWDSFNNLMLISRFEEEYKVKFTAVEIEQAQAVGDLFALMERKVPLKG
jgi:acyl carrier protein